MVTVIYGAGKRGKKLSELLCKGGGGVKTDYFCDERANEIQFIEVSGNRIPVITYEKLRELENCRVVFGIANGIIIKELSQKLFSDGIRIVRPEELLYENQADAITENRLFIADYHLYEMNDYFARAEEKGRLDKFWGEDSKFYKYFMKLNLTSVVELACGHGSHVNYYKSKPDKMILVDILKENIEFCKQRFKDDSKIEYYVNSGYNLIEIPDKSQTALFSYDSMVHFEMLDIFNYLKETERILKTGGMALFHHSNNTEDYRTTFSTGTSGRNYMSRDLFAYLCNRSGLQIVKQEIIDWGKVTDLDCITLVMKE